MPEIAPQDQAEVGQDQIRVVGGDIEPSVFHTSSSIADWVVRVAIAAAAVVAGCITAAAVVVGVSGVGHAGDGVSGVDGVCIVFYLCKNLFEFRF